MAAADTVLEKSMLNAGVNDSVVGIRINAAAEELKPQCNFCDRCNPCLVDYDKDKANGKKKREIKSK